ncbi:hypothetical protein D6779_07030, partial [Candidatus Parcubacteria bacterium]
FTRASTATYIDPLDGLVKTAAIDEPRFERMADGRIGFLLEGSSTNLLLQSNDFTVAPWGTTGTAPTLTPNTLDVTDILGTNTATKIVFGATSGGITQPITVTVGSNYTPSIYLRTLTGNVTVQFRDGAQALQSITVTPTWQRFTLPGTATLTTHQFDIIDPVGNAGTIYACAAQFEALPFATSYIPTTTTAVTRAGDTLQMLASGNWINDAGTLMIDMEWFGSSGILTQISSQANFFYSSNGTSLSTSDGSTTINMPITSGTVHRYGIRWNGLQRDLIDNGQIVSTLSTTIVPNITTGNLLGNMGGFYGKISGFRLWDMYLSNSEIAAA